jgi:MOSC domain-containing protein YiiM
MRVASLNVGRPRLLVHDGQPYSSAINRQPVMMPTQLLAQGFDGDKVADTRVHGGPDLAVNVYALENYAHVANFLGRELAVPSFGENLTTEGLLETEVCIGDTFRIGQALVQVSQPREPCFKLARKLGSGTLGKFIHETGHTGFYLRVLEPGLVAPGDAVEPTDRPCPNLTVAQAMRALFSDDAPRELVQSFADCAALSNKWRTRMAEKLT